MVKHLITSHGFDPEWTTKFTSKQAIHVAATWGSLAVIRYLIEVVEVDPTVQDSLGDDALTLAIKNQKQKTAIYLAGTWRFNIAKLN
jgi:ankyrin repeat protein